MTFSFSGIASRREYAYTLIIILAIETLVSVFFGWTAPRLVGSNVLNTNALVIGTIVSYAINIIAVVAQFSVTVRRLRGLGRNLLLVILLVIPIINLILALALLFGPESTEHDNLGRPIGGNGGGVEGGTIDQKTIDEELKRQAEEATRGANVVDTDAKDVKKEDGENK